MLLKTGQKSIDSQNENIFKAQCCPLYCKVILQVYIEYTDVFTISLASPLYPLSPQCFYLTSHFFNCIQKAVTSVHHSWFKKTKTILLTSIPQVSALDALKGYNHTLLCNLLSDDVIKLDLNKPYPEEKHKTLLHIAVDIEDLVIKSSFYIESLLVICHRMVISAR